MIRDIVGRLICWWRGQHRWEPAYGCGFLCSACGTFVGGKTL